MTYKKWAVIGSMMLVFLIAAGTIYGAGKVHIRIGSVEVLPPEEMTVVNGKILVPIHWIAEKLGASVKWNNKKKTIEIKVPENRLLRAQIDSFLYGLQPEQPKEAAEWWVKGIKSRTGAVQYAMLSPALQKQTRAKFEKIGWLTGASSPWIDHARFVKVNKVSDVKVQYTLEYELITSEGSHGKQQKAVTVEKNPEPLQKNWYITEITTKHNVYEVFTPPETVIK
jgi:hypothetical protein